MEGLLDRCSLAAPRGIDSYGPFLEPPLCAGEEAIYSRRRHLEARDSADIVSCQCRREKSLRALLGTL